MRNDADYNEAVERLNEQQAHIEEHEKELRGLKLSRAEIKRATDPVRSFHEQLKEEVENYKRQRRGNVDEFS